MVIMTEGLELLIVYNYMYVCIGDDVRVHINFKHVMVYQSINQFLLSYVSSMKMLLDSQRYLRFFAAKI